MRALTLKEDFDPVQKVVATSWELFDFLPACKVVYPAPDDGLQAQATRIAAEPGAKLLHIELTFWLRDVESMSNVRALHCVWLIGILLHLRVQTPNYRYGELIVIRSTGLVRRRQGADRCTGTFWVLSARKLHSSQCVPLYNGAHTQSVVPVAQVPWPLHSQVSL